MVENDCSCHCEECPEGTKLCPTSNFCLNETLWCNGYKECPDDESGCVSTVTDFVTETSPTYMSTTPITSTGNRATIP